MLLPRIITALIGIPVILGIVHTGSLPYALFITLIIMFSAYEYHLILKLGGKQVQRVPLYIFSVLMTAAIILDRSPLRPVEGDNLASLAIISVLLGCMCWEMFSKTLSLERIALTVFGIFFIPWTLAHMVLIRDIRPDGEFIVYTVLVTVWIMDTAAYAAGRSWGKTKLAELVSPKKTWEGAVAGFAAAVVTVLIMRKLFLSDTMTNATAMTTGFLIGVIGQVSDLAESVIKRT